MLYNQWYAILRSRDLGKEPAGLRRCGEDLVLWREPAGQVVCLPDRCSHRGAPLSQGRVHQGCLECPYHGLLFDARGECQLIPANGKGKPIPRGFHLTPRPVREAYGLIWLWWGDPAAQLPELPWFDELPKDYERMTTVAMEWKASFSRVMEGLLDAHHLPFLHGKVIPVGALVDPFDAELEGDRIRAWGHMRRDDGRTVEQAPGLKMRFELRFPGSAMLVFAKKAWLMYLCSPIDEKSAWVAVRYYHAYARNPLLRRIISRYMAWNDVRQVHPDDQRITEGAEARATGEPHRLIHADKAVLLWNKRCAELAQLHPPPVRVAAPVTP